MSDDTALELPSWMHGHTVCSSKNNSYSVLWFWSV